MTIAGMDDVLELALARGYAIGYFEAWDQHSLEATLEAAEEARAPTILGFGGAVTSQAWLDRHGVEEMALLARCLAERATVPAAVLFNEGRTMAQIRRALAAGCNAVMLDTSHLPLDENIVLTRQVVELAHATGATVEAELGHLPDASDPLGGQGQYTKPDEAAHFVSETGVDALAVSIGNTHLLVNGQAIVQLDLLERIRGATRVPLVIHGGSGFPEGAVHAAIARGVAKFNVGTCLKWAFVEGIQEAIAAMPDRPNIHHYVGCREANDILERGKSRIRAEIVPRLQSYGCAGQAGKGHKDL